MHHAESITPIPKVWQLTGPQVIREVVVHVHAHDANIAAEVTDALSQLVFCFVGVVLVVVLGVVVGLIT